MVMITLMGRDFDVAPYKLGAMRRAAPIVERINGELSLLAARSKKEAETEGGADAKVALVDITNLLSNLAEFVAIGIEKLDPSITAERLDDEIGLADMPALQAAFRDILMASGMKPGEAKAPSGSADPAAA